MLFNLIIFVLFATIVYFQYTQGLFSATLTAIISIIAAVVAIGYHELVTPFLMKLPEQADAVALVALFAVTFVVLRLIFDKVIPGNVRFPILVDKIGAGAMGIITGLFATGVLALAAQSLPFGPELGGYYRQDIQDRPNVTLLGDASGSGRPIDTFVADELVGDHLGDPNRINHLWFHQDDLVLGVTRQLGETGSALSNDVPLETAHPDYLLELFGQRLGAPTGTKRVAISSQRNGTMQVKAAWALDKAPAIMDGELSIVRGDMPLPDLSVSDPPKTRLVLSVNFGVSTDMTDTDGLLRFAPSNIRLKAGNSDYYPVGTLVGGSLLLENRPDDPMIINLTKTDQTVDFVFLVDSDDLKISVDKEKSVSFKNGSFLEIKRYALADLSGMELASKPPASSIEAEKDIETNGILGGVVRKRLVATEALKKLASAPQQAPSKNPPGSGAKGNGKPSGSPSSGGKDSDFVPYTPGAGMGL
jgi:hypothetical protein